jgi:hypothetical protein
MGSLGVDGKIIIKMELVCVCVVVGSSAQWHVSVNTVMNVQVP